MLALAPLVGDSVPNVGDPAAAVVAEQPPQLATRPPGVVAQHFDGPRFVKDAPLNLNNASGASHHRAGPYPAPRLLRAAGA